MSETDDVNCEPVAVIGLGHMGLPMAARLTAFGPVQGYDLDPDAMRGAAAAGVMASGSVAQLAAACRRVILMLPNSDVVDAVADEIVALDPRARATELVIDMSSSEPSRSRALSRRLTEHAIAFIDAPVSGGVIGAQTGQLTIMAGGEEADVAAAQDLLETLGSRTVHVGPVGSGHAVKALNNLLSATHLLASLEAAVVATRFGVAPDALLSVVNSSSGRSGSTELKLPRYVLTRSFDSGFAANLLEKDLRIAVGLAEDLHVDLQLGRSVLDRWQALNRELGDDADHTEIGQPLEARAGIELRAAPSGD